LQARALPGCTKSGEWRRLRVGGFLALASIERKIPPLRKRKKKGFSKEGGFSFFLL